MAIDPLDHGASRVLREPRRAESGHGYGSSFSSLHWGSPFAGRTTRPCQPKTSQIPPIGAAKRSRSRPTIFFAGLAATRCRPWSRPARRAPRKTPPESSPAPKSCPPLPRRAVLPPGMTEGGLSGMLARQIQARCLGESPEVPVARQKRNVMIDTTLCD